MVRSLAARLRLGLVVGLLVVGAAWMASTFVLLRQADRSRQVQIATRRLEAHAQDISSMEWEAIARGAIPPELAEEFAHARGEVQEAADFIESENASQQLAPGFGQACRDYIAAVERELTLVRAGRIQEAEDLDRRNTDPQWDQLKTEIDEINAAYTASAERTVRASRQGIILAALLAMAVQVFLLHRLEYQRHKTDLALTEQWVLRRSEERFRALTNHAADLVVVTDRRGAITYISPSVRNVLGVEEETLSGATLERGVHPDDVAELRSALAAAVESEGITKVEFRYRHADQSWMYFECKIRNLLGDPMVGGLLLNARDITLRKKALNQLAYDAAHDSLTKLPNRAVFLNRLQAAVERLKRHPELIHALMFVDIDDFKVVNDCLGHDTGDLLIQAFAERLSSSLRREDALSRSGAPAGEGDAHTVARLGGDEFTVLLEDLNDPSDAIRVAQRIQSALAEPFLLVGQQVFKGASIGIAVVSPGMSAETAMSNADTAMYRAKSGGKSRCEVFDEAMHAQVTRRMALETALRYAVDRREFHLVYQPIVSLKSQRVEGFEALLRWQPRGKEIVFPDAFVGVAESMGLIIPIGQWTLRQACCEAAKWQESCPGQTPYVSVNVSGRQFAHPGFLEQLRAALAASHIDPSTLILEITESTAMEGENRAEEMMEQVRGLGVRLSIDDFGTGYSSLDSLRRFPVSMLKIDRSFVSGMVGNTRSGAIVMSIISLAHNLGMNVVAEGLENREQLDLLCSSCDSGQGYLFSKPLPADRITEFLRSHAAHKIKGAGSE